LLLRGAANATRRLIAFIFFGRLELWSWAGASASTFLFKVLFGPVAGL